MKKILLTLAIVSFIACSKKDSGKAYLNCNGTLHVYNGLSDLSTQQSACGCHCVLEYR